MSVKVFGAIALMCALAGCQLGNARNGEQSGDVAAPSAIQGPAVEVTSLAPATAPKPAGEQGGAAVPSTPPASVATAVPVAPPKPKSASRTACEKRGGQLIALGRSQVMTCQLPTRDSGKQCRKESDCDGVCLARSRTCAPAKPLMGCQSILQEDGARVELCID